MWACATWVPQSVGKTWRQQPIFDVGMWLNDAFDMKNAAFCDGFFRVSFWVKLNI